MWRRCAHRVTDLLSDNGESAKTVTVDQSESANRWKKNRDTVFQDHKDYM